MTLPTLLIVLILYFIRFKSTPDGERNSLEPRILMITELIVYKLRIYNCNKNRPEFITVDQ
jgi:hypothetical protein